MTESAFPFGVAQPAAGDDTMGHEASRSRRPLLLLAVVALVLAVGAGAYFFLLGGSDSPTKAAAAPVTVHKAVVAPGPVVKPTVPVAAPAPAAPPAAVPPVSNAPLGRDPFKPLYVAPVAAPATPVAAVANTSVTTVASTADKPTVSLVGVTNLNGKQVAQTKVGDLNFTPVVGEVFAKNYKLVSLSGVCATFLNGDERFALCPGQGFQP